MLESISQQMKRLLIHAASSKFICQGLQIIKVNVTVSIAVYQPEVCIDIHRVFGIFVGDFNATAYFFEAGNVFRIIFVLLATLYSISYKMIPVTSLDLFDSLAQLPKSIVLYSTLMFFSWG